MNCPKCKIKMITVYTNSDWDGDLLIYGCPKCKRLWLWERKLSSTTTQLLMGDIEYSITLKPYTRKYCCYRETKQEFLKLLQQTQKS